MGAAALYGLGLLVVLGLWMLGAHNRVMGLKTAVLAAWVQVDEALSARAAALAGLLPAVAEPLAGEVAALDAVANAAAQVQAAADTVRRAPLAPDALAELGKADAALGAALGRLLALIEQHPPLLADDAVAAALQALREVPPRFSFARQVFNLAGTAYNAATTQFPTRLLAPMFRFGRAGSL